MWARRPYEKSSNREWRLFFKQDYWKKRLCFPLFCHLIQAINTQLDIGLSSSGARGRLSIFWVKIQTEQWCFSLDENAETWSGRPLFTLVVLYCVLVICLIAFGPPVKRSPSSDDGQKERCGQIFASYLDLVYLKRFSSHNPKALAST